MGIGLLRWEDLVTLWSRHFCYETDQVSRTILGGVDNGANIGFKYYQMHEGKWVSKV